MIHFRSVVFALAFMALASMANAYMPQPEAMRLCRLRTGLAEKDIPRVQTRNEGCSLDCIMGQGAVLTAYADDGHECHEAGYGYRCVMGKCRGPEDKIEDSQKELDMSSIELSINSAVVADRDPYPTQGSSDAFVVVEVVANGQPAFRDNEIICYTHIIQDSSQPRWNFKCKPQPIRTDAKLKIVVLDSDKPDPNPEYLGHVETTVDTLLNAGPQMLTLAQSRLSGGPYTINLEIKGQKYKPKIE